MDLSSFSWTREPRSWQEEGGRIEIATEPHTDLWQRTYYHFRNDNAPLFQMASSEQFFSFTSRCDFSSARTRFDQCGICLYLDSENWIKASVEYEDGVIAHLGSVVTSGGFSDWATTEIGAEVGQMWYRLSRREDDFRIECSPDGVRFSQMRVCHLAAATDAVRFGVYAASPEDSSFTAVFDSLSLGPCVWLAHDGQQPDE